jgi:hypothetical protein
MSIERATPEPVRWAVLLLCLWVALELVGSVVQIIRIDPAATNALRTLVIYSLGSVGSLVVNGFLVYGIYLGRNWARMTFLILRVVGWLIILFLLFSSRLRGRFEGLNLLLACLTFPTAVVGLCLLFTPRGNAWFRHESS